MRGVEKLEIFIVQDSTSCVLGSTPTMPPYLDGAIIVRTVGMSDQRLWSSAVSRTGAKQFHVRSGAHVSDASGRTPAWH